MNVVVEMNNKLDLQSDTINQILKNNFEMNITIGLQRDQIVHISKVNFEMNNTFGLQRDTFNQISKVHTKAVQFDDMERLNATVNNMSNTIEWMQKAIPICSDPVYVKNGLVKYSGTMLGSFATYECNDNYTVQGPNEIKCLSTRIWDGETPVCVSVTPRLTISPQNITTKIGETIQLRCNASGTGPLNVTWSRIGGQMNPRSTELEGILEIRQVSDVDAGRYRCVVDSSSGSSDGYAIVEVQVPPSVIVSERDVYAQINNDAELRCDVTGSPAPTVRWSKENGDLPTKHMIQNGVLTIYNVQTEDGGRYICSAISEAGTGRDYAVLHVEAGPDIDNTGNVQTRVVNVGDKVTLDCIVTGTPIPTITWTRDDGPLPRDVVLGDGILIIPQAKIEDAGTYTCLATNQAGSVSSKVNLGVKVRNYRRRGLYTG